MPLLTATDIHRVKTPAAYLAAIAQAMHKRLRTRAEGTVTESADPVAAYIDHGRWVLDCRCGAGNSVHPDWRLAGCYACGTIWTNVQIPLDRAVIERVLLARPKAVNRNWRPEEPVSKLEEENAVHLKGAG